MATARHFPLVIALLPRSSKYCVILPGALADSSVARTDLPASGISETHPTRAGKRTPAASASVGAISTTSTYWCLIAPLSLIACGHDKIRGVRTPPAWGQSL